ncbi:MULTISPECIES: glucose-6-phosphate dehydrogenase [Psychrilyobacter]|uniref:Glucose-6-phosphate 1-dehydrogenase n=1 Tax=Psychrilyobacter piezotolerans TaxID=2293438 RepID=A0ABX9KI52_9FUSO|nr:MULTISPECIES: glucose-6-phosphate dehydrogenase [Psychrilyobacter]MCS5420219.1 glucose-6-phosphate dehydrogenase [Psychrilyobacter sp. S5]NDI77244.1 glucose-6-phosphate dehydrogenase [Psychrilyobacter piezotolerans]RDE63302.1 glucose-6-phosphate dehydrogenase [Psychrilyobacter sp. S5]REI41844.1 glucose-6-phosphate dehydrogenase [Psychrilyobacter piezotolerans]
MDLEMKTLCEPDGIEVNTQPFVLIIFGGGGDLSQKKLLPSLYNLFKLNKLNNDSYILSYGKKERTQDQYRELVKTSIENSFQGEKVRIEDSFLEKFSYLSGDSEKLEEIDEINKYICNFEGIKKYQIIFYLATPPNLAKNILNLIQKLELCDKHFVKKIVMEKPFGVDTESAAKLNKNLNEIFKEEEIYRIDHYLGKETVQNILFFRFGNSIFEPLWNRSFIDHIQITAAENIGIESRGNFYEKAGVLKDIIQNHMMQLIALVAMEPPANFEADCIRDEKVKIFKSISNMTDEYMSENLVLGQYGTGKINGENVAGYRDEKNVNSDSNTGTFFSGKFHVDNWRWAGVPFYVRAGKRLNQKLTEIVITFKIPPLKLFGNACRDMLANELVFSIQPEEKISLSINMKYPGMENYPHPVEMNFNYSKLDTISLTAYERLLVDCIKGDLTLFSRQDGIEEMWRVLDPIVAYFNKINFKFPNYSAGSWGPEKSKLLLEKDDRKWRI